MNILLVRGKREQGPDVIGQAILQNGDPLSFTVLETDDLLCSARAYHPSIFLLENSASLPFLGGLPGNPIAVFDEENHRGAAFLKDAGISAVDYGTSPRATISLSSLEELSATVAVQRNLVRSDTTILEPCEVMVRRTLPMSPRQLLGAAGVLLLAGVPWEKGLRF
ncbi:MAG: hypothetical protein PUC32_06065 [Oscillospiraceae bacterium]|nr:hypothetical protein [Oscillospiraceae bacterium]